MWYQGFRGISGAVDLLSVSDDSDNSLFVIFFKKLQLQVQSEALRI
jgi:hypothetical protein